MKPGDRVQMFRRAAVVDCTTRELYWAAKGTQGFVHEMSPKDHIGCARVELIAPGLAPGQMFLVNYADLELSQAPGVMPAQAQRVTATRVHANPQPPPT